MQWHLREHVDMIARQRPVDDLYGQLVANLPDDLMNPNRTSPCSTFLADKAPWRRRHPPVKQNDGGLADIPAKRKHARGSTKGYDKRAAIKLFSARF